MFSKSRKDRGFTLMEVLAVVAIIAVLVAVAVPGFTASKEKAREVTDIANIRGYYAEILVNSVDDPDCEPITVNLVQAKNGWNSYDGQTTLEAIGKVVGTPQANGTCEISWSGEDNKAVFSFKGPLPVDFTNPGRNDETGWEFAELISYFYNNDQFSQYVKSRMHNVRDPYDNFMMIQTSDGQVTGALKELMEKAGYQESDIKAVMHPNTFYVYLDLDANPIGFSYAIGGGQSHLVLGDEEYTTGGDAENQAAVSDYVTRHSS